MMLINKDRYDVKNCGTNGGSVDMNIKLDISVV